MSNTVTLKSEEARTKWRTTLEAAYVHKNAVVVERYGTPLVTIVNHSDWKAILRRLFELEMLVGHRKAKAEMEADPSLAISAGDFRKTLAAAGLS